MRKSINEKYILLQSHLTRGAWIEIYERGFKNDEYCRRTSHEVRGLKFSNFAVSFYIDGSHLTRGAWIEIIVCFPFLWIQWVAPHTRCVD